MRLNDTFRPFRALDITASSLLVDSIEGIISAGLVFTVGVDAQAVINEMHTAGIKIRIIFIGLPNCLDPTLKYFDESSALVLLFLRKFYQYNPLTLADRVKTYNLKRQQNTGSVQSAFKASFGVFQATGLWLQLIENSLE